MKKIGNYLLVMMILVQYLTPVMAFEEQPTINITKVKQGERELAESTDGMREYVIDGYEYVSVEYELTNMDPNKTYYLNQNGNIYQYYGPLTGGGAPVNISIESGKSYTLAICGDSECNEMYSQSTINLKLGYYEQIKNSKIFVTNISQGGKDIISSENKFTVNDKQNIEFTFIGTNLIDDAYYNVTTGAGNSKKYLGSELEKGIIHGCIYNPIDGFYISAGWDIIWYPVTYFDGVNYTDIQMEFVSDAQITDFSYNMSYSHPDGSIEKSDIQYQNYYVIDSVFHKQTGPLQYMISGTGYEDKDYTVLVEVEKGTEKTSFTKTVNGLSLNSSYFFNMPDDIFEINKETNPSIASTYNVTITIDYLSKASEYKYTSVGNDVMINAEMFFEDGKKNLSAFSGAGSAYFLGGFYETNNLVFQKYSNIYMNYRGVGFKDKDYKYELQYSNAPAFGGEVLETGMINGKTFNEIGVLFEVDNYKNYSNPRYSLTIYDGEELVFSSTPALNLLNDPTLANISLSSNDKTLYLRTGDYSYVATRNASLQASVSGLGFEDSKTYNFEYCVAQIKGDVREKDDCETVSFTGKSVNEGTATLNYDKPIDPETTELSIYTYISSIYAQGGFDVTLLDSKDLFPNLGYYEVDNLNDLIKIRKDTNVVEFINNIEVAQNGSVKIFDKDGINQIVDKIGTGMIARVIDANGFSIIDLDMVVNGDTNGDGNVSITDLVKVNRHLNTEDKLIGVYEKAANVSGSGTTNLNDLQKIANDLARIEELN